jgi:hypothetical protein
LFLQSFQCKLSSLFFRVIPKTTGKSEKVKDHDGVVKDSEPPKSTSPIQGKSGVVETIEELFLEDQDPAFNSVFPYFVYYGLLLLKKRFVKFSLFFYMLIKYCLFILIISLASPSLTMSVP